MTTAQLDQAKTEEFAGKVVGILNGGSLAQMISIGHQTGVSIGMMSSSPAVSL